MVFRVFDFFHHWYIGGSRRFAYRFVFFIRSIDQVFAVKITLEHFFEPLYGDYSPVGRFFGFFFRTFRVLLGSAVHLFFITLFATAYVLWLATPLLILTAMAKGTDPRALGLAARGLFGGISFSAAVLPKEFQTLFKFIGDRIPES